MPQSIWKKINKKNFSTEMQRLCEKYTSFQLSKQLRDLEGGWKPSADNKMLLINQSPASVTMYAKAFVMAHCWSGAFRCVREATRQGKGQKAISKYSSIHHPTKRNIIYR